jgi:hypothetical protein
MISVNRTVLKALFIIQPGKVCWKGVSSLWNS